VPDRQFVAPFGDHAAPARWTLPASLELLLKTAYASYDGSGAASAYRPCLRIISDSGHVVAEAVSTTTVAAGGSATVSWFPGFVGGGAGAVQALIGARIQASSTQTIGDTTNTDLVYQSVAFDTDGMANLASDARVLTVNTAGLYVVVCETIWAWTAASAGRRINAVTHNEFFSSGPFPANLSSSDTRMPIWQNDGTGGPTPYTTNTSVGLFVASAGDFFASGAYQASGVNQTANGLTNCFLSALLMGA
jgi:hypothetical protein